MAINAADGIYIHLCVNTHFIINGMYASTFCVAHSPAGCSFVLVSNLISFKVY